MDECQIFPGTIIATSISEIINNADYEKDIFINFDIWFINNQRFKIFKFYLLI
mgnify:CR=1 FL=1